jgi:serine/threonine protein kinase
LRRLRGRGGFGSVWEAIRKDGKAVALKLLPCDDNLVAQEIRSIQIIRQLRHLHLVHIEQVWCNRGYIVVTMDLADGSLLELLDAYRTEFQTPLVPHDVCNYLAQVAKVLDFLNTRQHLIDGHRAGIQHCDVKPTNLLLFGEKVKLSDFGLASLTGAPVKTHPRPGTLDYAAQEVFQGRLSDWTDQYALAVTYCQLRGGRLPFVDTPKTVEGTYVRPRPDLTMLTNREQLIIARALDPVPQDRWPSCSELMTQLSRVLT